MFERLGGVHRTEHNELIMQKNGPTKNDKENRVKTIKNRDWLLFFFK